MREIEHVAELWANGEHPGPIGWVEVLQGQVQDAGGNVLFSGTAKECAEKITRYRFSGLSLVPTRWNRVAEEEAYSEGPHWQLVTEEQ